MFYMIIHEYNFQEFGPEFSGDGSLEMAGLEDKLEPQQVRVSLIPDFFTEFSSYPKITSSY